MTILLTPFTHEPLCHGNTWKVQDEDQLAEQIASVALGQARHVQRILAGALLAPAPTTKNAANNAITLLTAKEGQDPWHRDGWLFQVISWIAANLASPNAVIRSPHMILAHKGFDGLQLDLDSITGAVTSVIIFEDKATDNPRETIRKDVWGDFQELEEGGRENVLIAEVSGLLQTVKNIDADMAIQNVIWKQARNYRVCITVGDSHATEAGRRRLFRDYDTVATGSAKRRRGETFYVKELRPWMEGLAMKSIAAVQAKVNAGV
jgi:hypothetical protein